MVTTGQPYFASLIGRPEGYPNNKDGKSLFFISVRMRVNINFRDAAAVSEPVYKVCVNCAFISDEDDANSNTHIIRRGKHLHRT